MTNSNRAKVSVCIPVYGVEKYIERCARSLFEQTMKDGIEFIFVNDCTKDKSIEILEQVLGEYPERKEQVKIIHHEKNKGLVAARKTGLAHATGDYIIHCDSDDWVDLNLYETMYNKAVEVNADVVCCPFLQFFSAEKTKVIKPYITGSCIEYIEKNFYFHLNSLCSKLYKKKNVHDETIICPNYIWMGEDLLRNIQMLLKSESIAFVSDVFYFYNCSNLGSMTATFSKKHFEQLLEIEKILELKIPKTQKNLLLLFKQLLLHRSVDCYYEEREKSTQELYYNYWKSVSLSIKIKSLLAKEISFKTKILFLLACVNFKFAAFLYFCYKSHVLLR